MRRLVSEGRRLAEKAPHVSPSHSERSERSPSHSSPALQPFPQQHRQLLVEGQGGLGLLILLPGPGDDRHPTLVELDSARRRGDGQRGGETLLELHRNHHGVRPSGAGLVAAEVHDIPAGKDCANRNTHPLSYSVEVAYSPRRKWCTSPQLPKARAILSWNAEPPAGQPNWKPVYGNVLECHIQIDKGLDFAVLAHALKKVPDLPPELAKSIEVPLEKVPPSRIQGWIVQGARSSTAASVLRDLAHRLVFGLWERPIGTPSRFLLGQSCLNCHSQVHGSNHPSGSKLMR